MQQLLIASLPSCTVHAPQLPVSQPIWVPVRSRSSRRKCTSSSDAGTSRSYVIPLISTEILRLVDVVDTLTPLLSLPPGGLPGPPTPRRGGGDSRCRHGRRTVGRWSTRDRVRLRGRLPRSNPRP